jgi:hypothetical protein
VFVVWEISGKGECQFEAYAFLILLPSASTWIHVRSSRNVTLRKEQEDMSDDLFISLFINPWLYYAMVYALGRSVYVQMNVQRILSYVHARGNVLPSTIYSRLFRDGLLAKA